MNEKINKKIKPPINSSFVMLIFEISKFRNIVVLRLIVPNFDSNPQIRIPTIRKNTYK